MAVKYVKDFSFPTVGGFHGDVQRYAKGGHVTKMPAKAKASAKDMPARAKPNAPAKGAPKMASKPAVGKRQGYDKGGRVPGREMDRLPTKRPPGRGKDLAPARPFKGKYEGYAEGGPVDEILPGDGRGGLEMAMPTKQVKRYSDEYDLPPLLPEKPRDDGELVMPSRPGYGPDLGGRRTISIGELMPLPEEPIYSTMPLNPRYNKVPLPPEERYLVPELPVLRPDRSAERREMVGARGARRVAREPMARRMAPSAATPRMGIPKLLPPIEMLEELPRDIRYYKKGGEVKGKKIAKVMREYKKGELHSGKNGPVVKNPKQAMAIALAQSRSKKAEGGLTSYEESGSAGGSNVTFKEAFRKAREQGLKEFSWKGDKYSTKLREESKRESKVEDKAPKAEMGRKGPESRGGKRNVTEMSEYKRERKMELPSDRSTSFRSEAEETGMSASERAEKARGYAENLMNVAGAGALLRAPAKAGAKALMRKASEFVGGRKMKAQAAEEAARKATPEYKEKAAQMEKFAEQMRARQKMGARYEEGGEVMSKGPKTRYSAARSRRESKERAMERRALDKARHAEMYAPGMSLDMADRKKHGGMPVHRRKPMYGGGKC